MNYETHYNKLIERARGRLLEGYTEQHHVVPRCMGGSDDADNLVRLTAEEHYVAHQLLVKMYPGHTGLVSAALMMSVDSNGGRVNNKQYGWLKRRYAVILSERRTGAKASEETRRKQSIARKGRIPWNKGKTGIFTEEALRKISEAGKRLSEKKGTKLSKETRAKMSASKKANPSLTQFKKGNTPWNLGVKHTVETCKNMSEAAKGRKPMSEETKRKMSITRTGQKRGPYKIRRTN